MKKVILLISVFLMLAQNGFALTDAEMAERIKNEPDETWKQTYRCNRAAIFHKLTADVSVCLKALKMMNENPYVIKEGADIGIEYLNTGVLYKVHHKNYVKAYEYYMKAAKLGGKAGIVAQKYLNTLCKNHSWACE